MATAYHYEALRKQRVIERAIEARKRLEEKFVEDATTENSEFKIKQKKKPHHASKRSNRPASAQGSQDVHSKRSKQSLSESPPQTVSPSQQTTTPLSVPRTSSSQSKRSVDVITHPHSATVSPTSTNNISPRSVSKSPATGNNNETPGTQTGSRRQTPAGTGSRGRTPVSNGSRGQTPVSNGTSTDTGSRNQSIPGTAESQTSSTSRSAVSYNSKGQLLSSRASTVASQVSSCTSAITQSTQRSSTKEKIRGSNFTAVSSRSTSAATSSKSWSTRAELKADAVRKDLHKQELVLRDSNLVMGVVPVEEELHLQQAEQVQPMDTQY